MAILEMKPVDKKLRDELARLAREHRPVVILYHGGSQPGTKRQILPLSVSGNRVRARDLASDEVKFFSLDKIEIIPEDCLATEYVGKKSVDNRTTNLLDVLKEEVEELEHLGWEVKLTEESIKLYSRANIGTIPRDAIVGLRRNYDQIITIALGGDSHTSEISSDRPWYVFGPDFLESLVEPEPEAGQTYKHLSKAVRVFLDQARRHAPK